MNDFACHLKMFLIILVFFYCFVEVTCLHLVTLDISGNRIATLPIELRNMISLVNLELENNPLTTPPANVRNH